MNADWRRYAACRGKDTSLFFPDGSQNSVALEAKAICAECPARRTCLEEALSDPTTSGIWAGTTERERRRIRRRRAA